MKPGFEWNGNKARVNLKKHRIRFDEAASVFQDPFLIRFFDLLHSESEERFLSIGISSRGRILIVAHTHSIEATRFGLLVAERQLR